MDSEILMFTDFYNDRSHTRLWKLMAIMDDATPTAAELAQWEQIKKSIQILRFSE